MKLCIGAVLSGSRVPRLISLDILIIAVVMFLAMASTTAVFWSEVRVERFRMADRVNLFILR